MEQLSYLHIKKKILQSLSSRCTLILVLFLTSKVNSADIFPRQTFHFKWPHYSTDSQTTLIPFPPFHPGDVDNIWKDFNCGCGVGMCYRHLVSKGHRCFQTSGSAKDSPLKKAKNFPSKVLEKPTVDDISRHILEVAWESKESSHS